MAHVATAEGASETAMPPAPAEAPDGEGSDIDDLFGSDDEGVILEPPANAGIETERPPDSWASVPSAGTCSSSAPFPSPETSGPSASIPSASAPATPSAPSVSPSAAAAISVQSSSLSFADARAEVAERRSSPDGEAEAKKARSEAAPAVPPGTPGAASSAVPADGAAAPAEPADSADSAAVPAASAPATGSEVAGDAAEGSAAATAEATGDAEAKGERAANSEGEAKGEGEAEGEVGGVNDPKERLRVVKRLELLRKIEIKRWLRRSICDGKAQSDLIFRNLPLMETFHLDEPDKTPHITDVDLVIEEMRGYFEAEASKFFKVTYDNPPKAIRIQIDRPAWEHFLKCSNTAEKAKNTVDDYQVRQAMARLNKRDPDLPDGLAHWKVATNLMKRLMSLNLNNDTIKVTKVGKAVNPYRHHSDRNVSQLAKQLIKEWRDNLRYSHASLFGSEEPADSGREDKEDRGDEE